MDSDSFTAQRSRLYYGGIAAVAVSIKNCFSRYSLSRGKRWMQKKIVMRVMKETDKE